MSITCLELVTDAMYQVRVLGQDQGASPVTADSDLCLRRLVRLLDSWVPTT